MKVASGGSEMPTSMMRRSAPVARGSSRLEEQAPTGVKGKTPPSEVSSCFRRVAEGPSPGRAELARLQSTVGNGAVDRLLRARRQRVPSPLQAKLVVGSANDPLEREADRVADQVLRTWSARAASVSPEEKDKACVHRRADAGHDPRSSFEADDHIAQRLSARQGGGQRLPAPVRDRMEAGFRSDFSAVRIHRDAEAAELSTSLAARAFTVGTDIYFSAGAYDPRSSSGRHLLAHELTHVVQQGGRGVTRQVSPVTLQRSPDDVHTFVHQINTAVPWGTKEEGRAVFDIVRGMKDFAMDEAAAHDDATKLELVQRAKGLLAHFAVNPLSKGFHDRVMKALNQVLKASLPAVAPIAPQPAPATGPNLSIPTAAPNTPASLAPVTVELKAELKAIDVHNALAGEKATVGYIAWSWYKTTYDKNKGGYSTAYNAGKDSLWEIHCHRTAKGAIDVCTVQSKATVGNKDVTRGIPLHSADMKLAKIGIPKKHLPSGEPKRWQKLSS